MTLNTFKGSIVIFFRHHSPMIWTCKIGDSTLRYSYVHLIVVSNLRVVADPHINVVQGFKNITFHF